MPPRITRPTIAIGADNRHRDHAGDPHRHAESGFHGLRHAIDLHHVADTETGQPAEDGEGAAQPEPLLAQAVLDGVHRPADMLAAVVLLAVVHGQHHFAVLGGHAHQGGAPHPEQRARPAEEDGGGDAGDIAGTDSGRQAGHQRLEGTDLAIGAGLVPAPLPHQAETTGNGPPGHELEADHQEQPGAEDQHQDRWAPYQRVDFIDQIIQKLHVDSVCCFGLRHVGVRKTRHPFEVPAGGAPLLPLGGTVTIRTR